MYYTFFSLIIPLQTLVFAICLVTAVAAKDMLLLPQSMLYSGNTADLACLRYTIYFTHCTLCPNDQTIPCTDLSRNVRSVTCFQYKSWIFKPVSSAAKEAYNAIRSLP